MVLAPGLQDGDAVARACREVLSSLVPGQAQLLAAQMAALPPPAHVVAEIEKLVVARRNRVAVA